MGNFMSDLDQKIIDTLKDLPDFLRGNHLIKLGIFETHSQIWQERVRNTAPLAIRLGKRRIVYPKLAVIEWLKQKSADSQLEFAAVSKKHGFGPKAEKIEEECNVS